MAVDVNAVDVVAVDSCEAEAETETEGAADSGSEFDEATEWKGAFGEESRPRLKAAKGCMVWAARHATLEIPG